jgi:Fe-S-cluster containining protein
MYRAKMQLDGGAVNLHMNVGFVQGQSFVNDIELIYPMVKHLGFIEQPMQGVNPAPPGTASHGNYYSCKHFDRESRNCTIYEIRPGMCRDYPYRSTCNYAACTWHERKTQPIAREERLRVLNEQTEPSGVVYNKAATYFKG